MNTGSSVVTCARAAKILVNKELGQVPRQAAPGQPATSPYAGDAPAPMMPLPLHSWGGLVGRRRFRAMNTSVEMTAVDWRQSALLSAAEDAFHDIEARFSRFRPDSELCRFNARTHDVVAASAEMIDLVEDAQWFNDSTGGIFEPAVLPQLEAAGYDRSFECVARDGNDVVETATRSHSIADVRIVGDRSGLSAPSGLRIDFGGIGKGHAVDTAAAILTPSQNFMINAGGDIYAAGGGPNGDGWYVAVIDPAGGEDDLDIIVLIDRAIATSTVAIRRWRRSGTWYSHIIDPRTGVPVESGVISASVIAGTATEADVFAKTALLLGTDEGARFLEEQRAPGLFVLSDGEVRCTAGWPGTAASRPQR
jgi:thiamine biosynthesis lipoprotein